MLIVVVWLLLIGSNCILSHLYLCIFFYQTIMFCYGVKVKLVIINCLYPLIMIYMGSIASRKFLMNYL